MQVALSQPAASSGEVLDGIGRAFFATMARDGGPRFGAFAGFTTTALIFWLVYWVRRETRRERKEQAAADSAHAAAMAVAAANDQGHEWVSVPARRPLTVQHPVQGGRFSYEKCETRSVSGGTLTFISRAPPPRGAPVHFTVDIEERTPLPLRGIVRRVEAATEPGGEALVEVTLGPIAKAEREHLVRWITLEEEREIVAARRGRTCPICERPLADEATQEHPTCTRSAAGRPLRSPGLDPGNRRAH